MFVDMKHFDVHVDKINVKSNILKIGDDLIFGYVPRSNGNLEKLDFTGLTVTHRYMMNQYRRKHFVSELCRKNHFRRFGEMIKVELKGSSFLMH